MKIADSMILLILAACVAAGFPAQAQGAGAVARVLNLRDLPGFGQDEAGRGAPARNPFVWEVVERRAPRAEARPSRLALEAIMWNREQPLAVINGKLVVPGDLIEDAMVMKIQKEEVLVRRADGVQEELRFPPLLVPIAAPGSVQ